MSDQVDVKSLFSKHVDTVIVLSGIVGSLLWMNHKFNLVDKQFSRLETEMAVMKTVLIMKTEMAVMKTVLIMKEVMPKELAVASAKDRPA